MKELRELKEVLAETYSVYKAYYHGQSEFNRRMRIISSKVKQLEQAIEAQEMLEAEKVALIDKEIESLRIDLSRLDYFDDRDPVIQEIIGLEKAKSIIQGE